VRAVMFRGKKALQVGLNRETFICTTVGERQPRQEED